MLLLPKALRYYFFSRARVSFPIIGLFLISLNVSAQENVQFHWPLTSAAEVALPSPYASLSFNVGRSVDSLRFTEEFGAMAGNWNTDNPNPQAYYEYTLTPAPGIRIMVNRINLEVSLSRVNMRSSVQYSYDGFTKQKTQINHTVYIGTHVPRNLPLKTTLSVTYPQTLSIRVYGWSTVDYLVDFCTRNVSFDAQVFGRDLLVKSPTDTLNPQPRLPEIEPVTPETLAALPETEVSPEILQSDAAIMEEALAAMNVLPEDILGGNERGGDRGVMTSNIFDTPGQTTWTCPAGVTSIMVECWGGGGRGSTRTSNGEGGGGGGGAYSRRTLSVVPLTVYNLFVGDRGSASNIHGQDSWFWSNSTVLAKGGIGVVNDNLSGANGGQAANCIGDDRFSGGNGADGGYTGGWFGTYYGGGGGSSAGSNSNGGNGINSNGGTSPLNGGNGGDGYYGSNGYGSPGSSPGGGGGGARRTNGTQTGGDGGNGQIIIWLDANGYCEGNAISQTNSGVSSPSNALGSPDNNGAILDGSDWIRLDLTNGDLLTAGGFVTARWRRGSGWGGNVEATVSFSADGTNWSTPAATFTISNNSYFNENINIPINARYIRIARAGGNRNLELDAISYNTPCAPPCTNPIITSQPIASTICAGHNTSFTVTATGTALTYQWQVNTGAGWNNITNGGVYSNATSATLSLTNVPGTYNGYQYRCVVSSEGCNTTSNQVNLTVNTIPAQPSVITEPVSPCFGHSVTYSVTNVSGVTYAWIVPSGWNITVGQGSNSITVTVGATGGTISVTPSNSCGTGTTPRTLNVTTSSAPATPGIITGTTPQCPNLTGQVYSIATVAGATAYNWSVPPGWTITAGAGTRFITVTTGATGQNGNISVTAQNACGASTARNFAVTVLPGTPAVPGAITGLVLQCPNVTGQVYSILAVPDATTYTWAVPTGWTITNGQGTTSLTVTTGALGQNGDITVTAGNSCGTSGASTLAVTIQPLPGQPGPIQPATTEVCQNSLHNFFVTPASNATGYTWTFTGAGTTFPTGQGTNVVSVRFGNQSGTLTVTPTNSCGNGPAQSIVINVSTSSPALPGAITGIIAPCIGSSKTYSVPDLGFLYTWSVPAGWAITAGQGTNSITVTVGATPGNISVTAGNACGGSSPRTLAVTPQAAAPAQPSEIVGDSPVCSGSSYTYSVTSVPFVVYTWSVPAGWTLVSGQGTNEVIYTVGNASGIITVTPTNDCGTGPARQRNIVVDTAPPAATSAITGNGNPCENSTTGTYTVTNITGITYTWTVPADWAITAGQGTNQITVTVGTNNGSITVVPSNGCGNGSATTLPVTVFLLPASAGVITGDQVFCEGTDHTYSVTAIAGTTYNWTVPAGWTINSGQNTHSINVTAGVSSGFVQVTPHNDCGDGPISELEVTVNPLPAAFTGPDGELCVGDHLQIGGPPVGANTYVWTANPAGEVFDFTISNPVVQPNENTTYTLVETNPTTGCSNTDSVTIIANQVINLTVIPASLEQTICTGGTTNIQLSSNISGTTFEFEASLTTGTTTIGWSDGTGPLISQTLTNPSSLFEVVSYQIVATAGSCENRETTVEVTINPAPAIDNQTATICSDAASGINFGTSTNGLAIASYTILSINNNGLTASAGNPVTGSGFAANEIADDAWTNLTTAPVNVVYTVQGVSSADCAGNQFTVTLTINPEPTITNSSTEEICSGASTNIALTSNIQSTYTWVLGTNVGAITGASAGSGNTINQTLTNPSSTTPGSVEYIVTPTATTGSCNGTPFTITVTVNPAPVVTNGAAKRICSGTSTDISLTSSTPASFGWTYGNITGGITGASNGSGNFIDQVLTNPSDAGSGTVEYNVTATSTTGGCASVPFTITVTVDPIPTVTASASPMAICPGEEFDLSSSSSLNYTPEIILTENFNSPTNNWIKSNNSTGGRPANAAWTLRPDNYNWDGYINVTFRSNDESQFYLSNSDAQGSYGTTRTYLQSPQFSTVGYESVSIQFYHHYLHLGDSRAHVEISTNGIDWNNLVTYSNTIGGHRNFEYEEIFIPDAYKNQASLYVRFYYYATWDYYWAIDNVTIKGTSNSTMPVISWTSNPTGFVSSEGSPQDITQTGTTTYTVSYTNPLSGCSSSASTTVTTKPLPDAEITADYCIQTGCIQLTATGGGTYVWNIVPPSFDPVICVDEAGVYSVTVTGTNGCVATTFMNASHEMVTNGTFTAGNTGFITDYGYVADNPALQNELLPEGLYSVGTDANNYHTNFFGRDRTQPGIGQFMIVNGLGNTLRIWEQTVVVEPNTDYYFSAWAMSLNTAGNYAQLRFEVNGVQVGTTAYLGAGPANNSQVNPSNWVRFYSNPTWNSGANTSATIRIVNLRPQLGGNDFGLDDISFGTLDAVPFVLDPSVVGGSDTVCEGSDVTLTSNITGGLEPYYFNWSGPNGFTSTEAEPVITNIPLAGAGIYTVEVTDSYGCDPFSDIFEVFVNPAPTATITGGGDYCQFAGSPFVWFNGFDATPPYTFEYNINGGPTLTETTWGTETSVFVFAPTNITGTFIYTITSVADANGCTREVNESTIVEIHALPSAYITGDLVVCPSSDNVYTGNEGMTGYAWSIIDNGSIPDADDEQTVTVTAGAICSESFSLTLVVSDEYGCNATALEVVMVDDTEDPIIAGSLETVAIEGCDISVIPDAVTTVAELEALNGDLNISDNCAGNDDLVVTSADATPIGDCPITIIRTYTITDACDNFATVEQTFEIDDNIDPTITFCPTNPPPAPDENTFTVIVNPSNTYVHSGTSWDATATDNCSETVTITAQLSGVTTTGPHTTLNGVTFNQGLTHVTWTATDACGNTATCEFDVEVLGQADLAVDKVLTSTHTDGIISAGDLVTYTVTVTNNGPVASGPIVLTDAPPVEILNPQYSLDGTNWQLWTATISFANLNNGESIEIHFRGTADCPTDNLITNTAFIDFAEGNAITDPDYDNNTDMVETAHRDNTPPTFELPTGPFSYCVNNIITATYNPTPNLLIIPEYDDVTHARPEYYNLESGSEVFDLDISKFEDNCCEDGFIIHWRIEFTDTPNPATVVHEPINWPDISGTGQLSDYGTYIHFPGDGVNFNNIEHHIYYWLTDCNGNSSEEEVITVTIIPRPNVIKQ